MLMMFEMLVAVAQVVDSDGIEKQHHQNMSDFFPFLSFFKDFLFLLILLKYFLVAIEG